MRYITQCIEELVAGEPPIDGAAPRTTTTTGTSAPSARSGRSCGRNRRSSTRSSRTRTARSTVSARGASSTTGRGPGRLSGRLHLALRRISRPGHAQVVCGAGADDVGCGRSCTPSSGGGRATRGRRRRESSRPGRARASRGGVWPGHLRRRPQRGARAADEQLLARMSSPRMTDRSPSDVRSTTALSATVDISQGPHGCDSPRPGTPTRALCGLGPTSGLVRSKTTGSVSTGMTCNSAGGSSMRNSTSATRSSSPSTSTSRTCLVISS